MDTKEGGTRDRSREVERMAAAGRIGLLREFLGFLNRNRKWWLVPLILALALVGVLVALASTPLAPFIYPLF